jgi:hypothetical protein
MINFVRLIKITFEKESVVMNFFGGLVGFVRELSHDEVGVEFGCALGISK